MSIDNKTVKKVAKLAKIKISESEETKLIKELNNILGWVDELKKVNTDKTQPMLSVFNESMVMREDKASSEISNDLVEKQRQFINVGFKNTSRDNNILIQAFEVSTAGSDQGNFKKLDMIDYGEFYASLDPERPVKRVFYIGKVISENHFDNLKSKDSFVQHIQDNEMKDLMNQVKDSSQSFFNIFTNMPS